MQFVSTEASCGCYSQSMDSESTPPPTEQLLLAPDQAAPVITRDNARLFIIYNGYRALVAFCLLVILVLPATQGLITSARPGVIIAGCTLLLLSAVALTGTSGKRLQRSEAGIFGLMLLDVTAIALITSGSTGVLDGFSVLYLITVAAAAIMLSTHILATLVAAIAVLAVLADAFWMVGQNQADVSTLLPAGILGSLLFTVSLIVQLMASRLAAAEAQVDAAEVRVAALQRLNQQIIVHMDRGIVLVDPELRLSPVNAAATRLLSLSANDTIAMGDVSPDLANQYIEWLESGQHKPEPFRIQMDGPALVSSFSYLDDVADSSNLIFIEDYTPVTQFAQSLKLNSLSKLTASIAHEIRNPLSAIRHAAQLLSESDTVDEADAVLCNILVNNSDRVTDIIENVTEVSRRKAPQMERIVLLDWLQRFLEDYRQQRTDDIVLTLEGNSRTAQVSIDTGHLQRVLSNLIDNALRHSFADTGESVAIVRVSVDARQAQVLVDIVDKGLGVVEHNIGRLFEPFFTTAKDGSGLGLYLCKELCEINGAGLVYQRTPANESAFRVSLKLEDE